MRNDILQWIDEFQSGKIGIYPYRVALEVCAVFGISIQETQDYVRKHIQNVLNKEGKK